MTLPVSPVVHPSERSVPRRSRLVLGFGLTALAATPFHFLPAAPAQALPALPPLDPAQRRAAPPPVANLPPAASPAALPALQNQVSCPALQQRITGTLAGERSVWSISVADGSGRLLADVNGLQPRSPASNAKLVSTAFALDRLGPDYRLSTQLWQLGDGTLRLTGQGDPDLALPQLQRFARLAIGQGGSSTGGPVGGPVSVVRLQLAEEPAQSWWPSGWLPADRGYAYGAPITRLAVTSNVIESAVPNPPARLQTLLQRTVAQQGGQVQLSLVSASTPLPPDAVLLHQEGSTSMHGLLSLANTESHNFTAEVLLRQAAESWDLAQASRLATSWMAQQGIPLAGVRIADGSGLDRTNRLTSRSLTALLLRMDHHPYGRQYLASMAVAGQRGTLRNLYKGTPLEGQFYGKTGTLRGVRAISGVLRTPAGPRFVSAISNGGGSPNTTIGQVLRQVQNISLCP